PRGVTIDGAELHHVKNITTQHQSGQLPTVTITFTATLETRQHKPPTYVDLDSGARITIGEQQVTQHQPVFTQTGNITQAWCNCGWILESTNTDWARKEADRHVAWTTKHQNES